MLHTISTSLSSSIHINLISDSDVVVFWQNGVITALQGNHLLEQILAKTKYCYILIDDVKARGLSDLIDKRVNPVNMEFIVQLTAKNYPQLNWSYE